MAVRAGLVVGRGRELRKEFVGRVKAQRFDHGRVIARRLRARVDGVNRIDLGRPCVGVVIRGTRNGIAEGFIERHVERIQGIFTGTHDIECVIADRANERAADQHGIRSHRPGIRQRRPDVRGVTDAHPHSIGAIAAAVLCMPIGRNFPKLHTASVWRAAVH